MVVAYTLQDAAAAAIFLAAKVEEFRVHINSVLIVTHQVRHGSSRKLDTASRVSITWYSILLLKYSNSVTINNCIRSINTRYTSVFL